MTKQFVKAIHDAIIIERNFEVLPKFVFAAWQDSEKRKK
jgi:uncharacterized protein YndB with AHSA1/START domain